MRGLAITTENFPIFLALACAGVSCIAYLVFGFARREASTSLPVRIARVSYYVSFAGVAYASVYLMQQILSHARYDIAYIHDYSSPTDALIYQVSSFWAGQEGSLLLWALFAGAIGLVFARKLHGAAPYLMSFWASVQVFLLTLLAVSDPFRKLVDFRPGMVGVGLNPLLKNPWMAIHPPLIFLGYAALIVPAAFAIQALVKGDMSKWAGRCLPWALFGWTALSAGIVLGMVWSYEVLGWGGYWGWDPVENASLVPWLVSTALVHGLLLQRYRGRMARANVVMALATFLLIVYATFLTRSGVLSDFSVHSFADLGAHAYLLGFLIFYAAFCLILMAMRRRTISASSKPLNAKSKDFVITLGVICLVLFAVVVLVGTSYPVIFGGAVLPRFYTRMSIPVAAVIVVLLALAPRLRWSGSTKSPGAVKRLSAALVAHVGVVLLILGVVFSTSGKSSRMVLTQNGSAKRAFGYEFTYVARDEIGFNKEVIRLKMRRGADEFDAPMSVEFTERGSVRSPYIHSTLLGDLYISPADIQSSTVTPTASMTHEGWVASPVKIGNSGSTLTLLGMQVESKMARLEYTSPGKKPAHIEVVEGKPASADGYTFTFKRFVSSGGGDMTDMTAGAEIAVSGRNLAEKVIIEVSTKPLIWLLWLGTALILMGGAMAVVRGQKVKDGLLPDSDRPDK